MRVAFNNDHFAFEFVRNLGFMYYGGSDLGEMITTANQIEEGDFESWFTEWDKRASRIRSRADSSLAAGHLVSAGEAYLRASTYFRMAEFYLHGKADDPRIISESRASQGAYAKGAALTRPMWEPIAIPYEGTTLPGYFYKVDNSGVRRPTIVFHGGFNSSLEELFYYGGAPAILRGYHCLTFDGPGQGAPIREQNLPFRFDWEAVVTPAVDFALARPDVDGDNLVLIGMSLGGYLAARAAAFEHRLRAAVFFDGVYDFHDSLRKLLPEEAIAAFDAGESNKCEEIVRTKMQHNTTLRWVITQETWSFGVQSVGDLLEKSKQYTLQDVVGRIKCPCLVMEADGDIFFAGQPQRVYDELRTPKGLARFTAADGAENHCQSGALAYKDEIVFNWISDTLKSQEPVKARVGHKRGA